MIGAREADADAALAGTDFDPTVEQLVAAQVIEGADKLPRVVVQGFVAFLKLIQFLQYSDRHHHVVFLKVVHARAVVKNDIGIEDKEFFLSAWHDPKRVEIG